MQQQGLTLRYIHKWFKEPEKTKTLVLSKSGFIKLKLFTWIDILINVFVMKNTTRIPEMLGRFFKFE